MYSITGSYSSESEYDSDYDDDGFLKRDRVKKRVKQGGEINQYFCFSLFV